LGVSIYCSELTKIAASAGPRFEAVEELQPLIGELGGAELGVSGQFDHRPAQLGDRIEEAAMLDIGRAERSAVVDDMERRPGISAMARGGVEQAREQRPAIVWARVRRAALRIGCRPRLHGARSARDGFDGLWRAVIAGDGARGIPARIRLGISEVSRLRGARQAVEGAGEQAAHTFTA
jgi:hypothetical protein